MKKVSSVGTINVQFSNSVLIFFYDSLMPSDTNGKYLFCFQCCFVLQTIYSASFSEVGNPTPVYLLHNSYSHHCLFTSRRNNFFVVMLELTCPVASLQIFNQILGPLKIQNLSCPRVIEYLVRVESSLLFFLVYVFYLLRNVDIW